MNSEVSNEVSSAAPRLAVFGSVNMDLVAYVDEVPGGGETVTGTGFRQVPGGKGANQAVAAARAGADVTFLGAVGDDAFGTELRANLVACGIDASGLRTVPGVSGVAHIVVDGRGGNRIIVVPGANGEAGVSEGDEARLAGSAALLLHNRYAVQSRGSHVREVFDHYDQAGKWAARISDKDLTRVALDRAVPLCGPAGKMLLDQFGRDRGDSGQLEGSVLRRARDSPTGPPQRKAAGRSEQEEDRGIEILRRLHRHVVKRQPDRETNRADRGQRRAPVQSGQTGGDHHRHGAGRGQRDDSLKDAVHIDKRKGHANAWPFLSGC